MGDEKVLSGSENEMTKNDAVERADISRDAQLVAQAWFPFGEKCEVSFRRPHIITEWAMGALKELEAAGMIKRYKADHLPKGAKGWKGTKKLGFPLTDFPKPKKTEKHFKLLTE